MKIFLEKFVLGVPEAKTFKTDKRSSFGIAFKVEGLKEGDEVYLVQDGEELELDEEIVEGYLTYSSTATETMEYVVEVLRDEKVVQEFRIKNVVVDSNEFFKDASGGGDVTKEYVDEELAKKADKAEVVGVLDKLVGGDNVTITEDENGNKVINASGKDGEFKITNGDTDVLKVDKGTNEVKVNQLKVGRFADIYEEDSATTLASYINQLKDDITTNPIHLTGEYEDGTAFGFNLYGMSDAN